MASIDIDRVVATTRNDRIVTTAAGNDRIITVLECTGLDRVVTRSGNEDRVVTTLILNKVIAITTNN